MTAAWLADVHQRFERDVVPALSRYVSIPCLSPDFDPGWEAAGHLGEAAELLAGYASRRAVPGITAEVVQPAGRTPVLVVEAPASPGAQPATVLVYGHLDKQPPLGTWRSGLDPFTAVRRGERLYGRGTGDDGYSCFAALSALEALVTHGVPHARVVVLVEASEESGSPDLPAHLDDLAGRIGRPDAVLCLDSGCDTYDRLWLTASLRGNLVCEVTVQVLTEGVHSGMAGAIVPTSWRLLSRLLARVEDPETGDILLPELQAEIPDAHRRAAEAAAALTGEPADDLPAVAGLVMAGTSPAERLLRRGWWPSLTVTGVAGLPPPESAGNVLRPSTTAKVSLRLPPTVDAEAAQRSVEAALTADPPDGAAVSVRFGAPADGWVAPDLDPWLSRALAGASLEAFGQPPAAQGEGGTIPFLAMLARRYPGTPLVAMGVLGPGSNAHGPNEFLHLPMAEAVTLATARVCAAAGAPERGDG